MSLALRPVDRLLWPAVALTWSWREKERSWHLGRVAGLVTTAIFSLLMTWCVVTTAYFLFHDQLVASLISHQVDVQYSYEDRIAALQTQLDRETSRGLLDRQTLATKMRDLASKSELLEARAVAIDALIRGLESGKPLPLTDGGTLANMSGSRALDAHGLQSAQPPSPSDTSIREDHADASPEERGVKLLAALERVEARQSVGITLLRTPLLRKVARVRTALLDAGLPISRWKLSATEGVGGPFVPFSKGAGSETFEQSLTDLRSAQVEEARLIRLIDAVPLRRPIDSPLQITSPFGARLDPFLGQAAMHTGVDLMETYGAPVKATAGGTVIAAGSEGGYGNMVEVDHGDGITTRYAHLSAITVANGQRISAGATVGRVGSTGRATGPHLHYETRVNGTPVDPTRFLKAGAGLFSEGLEKRG